MTLYQLPVTSEPDQSFATVIPRGKTNLYLGVRLRYNLAGDFWSISLSDSKTKKLLVADIPLLGGVYPSNNLLKPYAYLGLGGLYCAPVSSVENDEADDRPKADDLGSKWLLLWEDYET